MFAPNRILLHKDSATTPKARLIIRSAKALNPTVITEKLPTGRFTYPAGVTTPKQKYEWVRETVIVRPRVERFIKTFPSPGDIVEDYTTILNLSWQCPHACEYCYLQTTRPAEHSLYTNIDVMERELRSAPFAHRVALTIWSMLSHANRTPFLKIPPGLRQTADQMRVLMADLHVRNDRAAMSFLSPRQKLIYGLLKDNSPKNTSMPPIKDFLRSRQELQTLYDKNKHFTLTLVASEFNDLLAVDHLAEYTNDLLPLLAKIPEVKLSIRSKASFVNHLVTHDGLNRTLYKASLNTQHVIETYEHGTASLDDRVNAALRVQQAQGFRVGIAIEPIIRYEGFLEDYVELIDRLFSALDPARIERISLGSVRYRKQLRAMILKHHPSSDLFDHGQDLQEPEGSDARLRYSRDVREATYGELIKAIRVHSDVPVTLGAEHVDLWSTLGISHQGHLQMRVAQFDQPTSSKETEIVTK